MTDQSEVLYGATMVPVRDVVASIGFYVDVLGFEKTFLAPDGTIGMVRLGPAAIQLQACDDAATLAVTANNIATYIELRNLDAFFDARRDALEALPEGRFRPPFAQAYGMREMHVKDPDGFLMFFGEDMAGDS